MATGITEYDVWRAADELLLEGLRPTIERVRHQIGRGSPNTVSPHLETWFKTLGARIKDPGGFLAPAALPDPVNQAAKHLWDVASATARTELQEQASIELAELEKARRATADREQALESREAAVQGQLRAQAQSLELAQRETVELRARLEEGDRAAREHEGELVNVRQGLTAARAQATQLQERLDGERAQWVIERRDVEARCHANEQRWVLEVERAREQPQRLEAQIARDRSQFGAERAMWADERKALEAEVQLHLSANATLHAQLDATRNELERLTQDCSGTLDMARVRENEALQRAAQAESQLADALIDIKEKGAQLAHLVQSLLDRERAATQVRPD